MAFLGQYTLSVTDGYIQLPWSAESLASFSWYLSETFDRKNLILYVTNLKTPDIDHILDSGDLILNEQALWALPSVFLEYLGERLVSICGFNEYFEICAKDYFDQQIEMIDDLFEGIGL